MATTSRKTEIDPLDFLATDALLSDEERAIRDTVRRFVSEQVKPYVGEWFERGELPTELIPELARLGLFGMHLEGYGLPEASSVMYGLVCQELEAGDAGIRSLVSVQGSLSMYAIWKWGSEEQKQRWLPADARGREDRLLRADRARRRLRPRLDAHDGEARRLGLDPQRREDVDHERLDRRRRDRLGSHRRRRHQRLPGREGHARVRGAAHAPQALAAGLGHVGARAARRARARGEPLPRDLDPARAALLPQRGALRDRVRRRRLGAHVPRDGARLLRRSGSSSTSRSPATS